ncbi:hypothetical protein CRG98_006585 [Punica granatum]|uniref:Uncharacterized protein n=1 Tax=Punica granatum TaxID=22663 RepID=A0A2I0KX42_PUNGR|nr:hypothetical protein CRG98_006585 [Punica granatum]
MQRIHGKDACLEFVCIMAGRWCLNLGWTMLGDNDEVDEYNSDEDPEYVANDDDDPNSLQLDGSEYGSEEDNDKFTKVTRNKKILRELGRIMRSMELKEVQN